jgi:hypothetical protein
MELLSAGECIGYRKTRRDARVSYVVDEPGRIVAVNARGPRPAGLDVAGHDRP